MNSDFTASQATQERPDQGRRGSSGSMRCVAVLCSTEISIVYCTV